MTSPTILRHNQRTLNNNYFA